MIMRPESQVSAIASNRPVIIEMTQPLQSA
jgi:hypothetical protein